jgi:hypothetical protein
VRGRDHRHRPHLGRRQADGHDRRHLALVSGRRGADRRSVHRGQDGRGQHPAYRGTAYVVFEELALSTFGNRLPQLSFEVFRPLADPDTAEGLVKAVTMIPASGEFTYATAPVRKTTGGGGDRGREPERAARHPDIVVALDRLQAMAPAVESVSLVVAWFGDDLRAGTARCGRASRWRPRPPRPRQLVGEWRQPRQRVLVSRDAEDRPVYGGTPADFAVVQAIQEMKARGLRVTFYPFLLMDVPPGNTLPNPYSANAATPASRIPLARGGSPVPRRRALPDRSTRPPRPHAGVGAVRRGHARQLQRLGRPLSAGPARPATGACAA